jgi:hypothetical protein
LKPHAVKVGARILKPSARSLFSSILWPFQQLRPVYCTEVQCLRPLSHLSLRSPVRHLSLLSPRHQYWGQLRQLADASSDSARFIARKAPRGSAPVRAHPRNRHRRALGGHLPLYAGHNHLVYQSGPFRQLLPRSTSAYFFVVDGSLSTLTLPRRVLPSPSLRPAGGNLN